MQFVIIQEQDFEGKVVKQAQFHLPLIDDNIKTVFGVSKYYLQVSNADVLEITNHLVINEHPQHFHQQTLALRTNLSSGVTVSRGRGYMYDDDDEDQDYDLENLNVSMRKSLGFDDVHDLITCASEERLREIFNNSQEVHNKAAFWRTYGNSNDASNFNKWTRGERNGTSYTDAMRKYLKTLTEEGEEDRVRKLLH